MTMIYRIRTIKPKAHRVFVAERLRALKASIAAQITDFGASTCMRLATWKLKHFGKGERDSGHFRDVEPLLYIAEIISAFDLVAIQEVNENLDQLDELVSDYLGPEWDYVVTDTTEGTAGNHERLAFVYRMPKVRFEKVAGEIVLPRGQKIVGPEEENPDAEGDLQFARTPFVVAFQSGWLRFKICTVHIYYGGTSSVDLEQRRREIDRLAEAMSDRQAKEQTRYEADRPGRGRDANYILIGDFNIKSPEHHTMQALLNHGFVVPDKIKDAASSLSGDHYYDQIVTKMADDRASFGMNGGVFKIFETVYRDEDAAQYYRTGDSKPFERNSRGEPRNDSQKDLYYKRHYRRNKLSDHNLLWCEIGTDFSDHYLAELAGVALGDET